MEKTTSKLVGDNLSQKTTLNLFLAESKSSITQSIESKLRHDNLVITICHTLEELNQEMDKCKPNLLIIGELQDASCLELHRKYSKQWQDLTIVLLVHQPEVNEFFRNWAISKGVHDVLSSSLNKIHFLQQAVVDILIKSFKQDSAQSSQASIKSSNPSAQVPLISYDQVLSVLNQPDIDDEKDQNHLADPDRYLDRSQITLTYDGVIAAIQQITNCSMNYFGAMAIANYWKKSQAVAVIEHPWLACWNIDHRGAIAYFSREIPTEQLTSEQCASLQLWIERFLRECERIMNCYTEMLNQMDISPEVRQLISKASIKQ